MNMNITDEGFEESQGNPNTYYIADTNVLLDDVGLLDDINIVITSHVLREIEELELKRRSDGQLQMEIRKAKRYIRERIESNDGVTILDIEDYKFTLSDKFDENYVDNILLQVAVDNEYGIVTNDVLLKLKAMQYDIPVASYVDELSDFSENKGFKVEYLGESELLDIYQSLDNNRYNLMVNEYLVIYDDFSSEDRLLDVFKWDGESLVSLVTKTSNGDVSLKGFRTDYFGKFKPKDVYQLMAVDSIQSNQLTQVRGGAGSGKSKIALEVSWNMIERGEFDKLVIFVNPTPAKDAQELGFYSGSVLEKVMQSSVGAMLKSKFGDEMEIVRLIADGKLEILPMVDIRGYETGNDKRTILWILESQNLTSELMKLGMQRVSETTKVIIDGDYHQQVDKYAYQRNNGMKRVSEVFRGKDLYGEVELQEIYRSRIASIADEM